MINGFYCFGGKRESEEELLDSMRVLCNQKGTFSWRILDCKGLKPIGRKLHSLDYLPELNSLILFGGKDSKEMVINEIHLLNLQTLCWMAVEVMGNNLTKCRFGHASLIHEGKLIIASGEAAQKTIDWFSGQLEISR